MFRTKSILIAIATLATVPAQASPVPDYDFDWAIIGTLGNPPYPGGPHGGNVGRGRVDYSYRISTREVSTSQWMEFVNTFSTQSDDFKNFAMPAIWGAQLDPSYSGPGRRYRLNTSLPDPSRNAVFGITWRDAALFCNWLHHGKTADFDMIQDGAYDASTFADNDDGTFDDQLRRSLGARFWIPSLDEWMKAAHYDPDRYGTGEGGWWVYPHRSDEPPIPGWPGEGETTAGIDSQDAYYVPLGAYDQVRSAYGLLDLSGGAAEWLEELGQGGRYSRRLDGTWAATLPDNILWYDTADLGHSNPPSSMALRNGLRVASAVPCPPAAGIGVVLLVGRRKRR